MKNLGEVSHYLAIEVDIEVGKEISLRQTTYHRKILERFQMPNYKPASIPMNPGVDTPFSHLSNKLTEPQLSGTNQQSVLLCGPPYIPDPTSRIQWEFLVGITQISAPFIAIWSPRFFGT